MENLVRRSNFINDWDLEAIIRGGWGGGGSASSMAVEEVAATWQPLGLGLFEGFDESVDQLEATATVLNELEELYKPFLLQQPTSTTSDSPAAGPTTTSSLSSPAIFNGGDDGVDKQEVMRPGVADDHTPARASCKPVRGRKRKQKTRVVQLGVGEDDDENLRNMDQWNWRKYGQKSIKGSPYPRSYYRCSSSVGCGARKQVEQSMNHPYTYIVTYIGDHAHPLPARRRSVAGRKLAYVSSWPPPPP